MDWRTWAPFRSKIVAEITEHMTEEEKQATAARGFRYGIWVGFTWAVPLSILFMLWLTASIMPGLPIAGWLLVTRKIIIAVCVCLIAVHIVGIPIWLRMQKSFMASTEWARQQGYTARDIRMFR